MDGEDILDHVWDNWCNLCQKPHRPCVSSQYGGDGFVLFMDKEGNLFRLDEPFDPNEDDPERTDIRKLED